MNSEIIDIDVTTLNIKNLDLLKELNQTEKLKLKDRIKNYIKNSARKKFLDINKLLKDKMKKDALEEMKQKDKCKIGTNDLEKLINDKLRKKFLDRLKNNNNIKNVCYKL